MSYLVDSNVLLRLVYRLDSMHGDAENAYMVLRGQNQGKSLHQKAEDFELDFEKPANKLQVKLKILITFVFLLSHGNFNPELCT
ncbi:hypothetical protein [Fischerella thermalis]|uniref:hypothetical protein n=1 Tax=Fischerella thermalis TaxID=372787 RepID=UPI0011AFB5FF|nr:hypothetical protein [Fischerella thermalis]